MNVLYLLKLQEALLFEKAFRAFSDSEFYAHFLVIPAGLICHIQSGLHNYCQELGGFSVHGFHGMLIVGIKINGISLIEDNFVVMDVNLQASLEHVIEFLPGWELVSGFVP